MEYPTLINFSVTQTDIDEGQPCSCTDCPAALAIARACDHLNLASQASQALWDYVNSRSAIDVIGSYVFIFGAVYTTDTETEKFIHKFDAGKPVEPFSGQLRLKEVICEG